MGVWSSPRGGSFLAGALATWDIRSSEPVAGEPSEPYAEDGGEGDDLWGAIRSLLPDQREQRLAYLLSHCDLKPKEIVHFCSQEFSEVQEIYRPRRNILEQLPRLVKL